MVMSRDIKQQIIRLLREYAYIFVWYPKDILRINESVVVHKLSVDPSKNPIKQKRINFTPDCQVVINEEVDKLLKTDLICEI